MREMEASKFRGPKPPTTNLNDHLQGKYFTVQTVFGYNDEMVSLNNLSRAVFHLSAQKSGDYLKLKTGHASPKTLCCRHVDLSDHVTDRGGCLGPGYPSFLSL